MEKKTVNKRDLIFTGKTIPLSISINCFQSHLQIPRTDRMAWECVSQKTLRKELRKRHH